MRGYKLGAVIVAVALVLTGAHSFVSRTEASTAAGTREPAAAVGTAADPVVVAAGDIACGKASTGTAPETCKELQTSDLLLQMNPAAVLPLGDVQYEKGELDDFYGGRPGWANTGYDSTWGRLKSVTRPAVGNHEYEDPAGDARGYYDYFNGPGNFTGPAGDRTKGYYSFDIGNWHLVALNSNCSFTVPPQCGVGTAQEQWLRADLAAHPRSCTLAYLHHPRWSSKYDTPYLQAMFQALYDHGVELLLAGHSHFYERFAPQDPSQTFDPGGVRQIVVGTGGRSVSTPDPAGLDPNSEVRNGDTFGVLKLTLHPNSYDWQFVPMAGQMFTDSGSGTCHPITPDVTPPTPPTLSGDPGSTFQTKPSFPVTWGGAADGESGVATYSVTVRRAVHNGVFGDPTPFQTGVPAGSATFTGEPGSTYCFRATATDWAGNTSATSADDCTTIPVDNVSFRHWGGWAKKRGTGYYLESFSQTRNLGATLTLKNVTAKHLAIIVTTCPRCGALRVFFGGKLVSRIQLRSSRTTKLRMITVKTFDTPQTGTVKVRVSSRGRLVRVEGLGVSAV